MTASAEEAAQRRLAAWLLIADLRAQKLLPSGLGSMLQDCSMSDEIHARLAVAAQRLSGIERDIAEGLLEWPLRHWCGRLHQMARALCARGEGKECLAT